MAGALGFGIAARRLKVRRPWLLVAALALTGGVTKSALGATPPNDQAANAATQATDHGPSKSHKPTPSKAKQMHFEIDEYRVEGADSMAQIDVEEAVYPFLGPGRSADDVEKARAALEKSYHDKGFQTVSVSIPQQNPSGGIVVLKVTELKVGRLRVKNSHYFDTDKIKQRAASLKEGTLPNFNDVTRDIVALNQWPDRRITPALRAGVAPGTVDVDLNVEDKVPIHGNVEINDRQSPGTSLLRVTGTAHYDNFWQLGHSFTFTYQVAPEHPADAQAFSGNYLARVPNLEWLSFLLYGVVSNSNVAAIGGVNVVGPGQIAGARAVLTLPTLDNFAETLSFGPDYKHFDQTVNLSASGFSTPVTYVPVSANYGATFQEAKAFTQLDVGSVVGVRGLGSGPDAFDAKRFDATANFAVLKGDLSRTQDLPAGFQLYGKVQGQVADQPLVSSEQFSLGGFDTVRGYLESEVLGDSGAAGTFEIRSPDIGSKIQSNIKGVDGKPVQFTTFNNWRFFAFLDGGVASIIDPLPEQQTVFDVWSYGFGTTFQLLTYLNGMVAIAVPKVSEAYTEANRPRALFRVWGEF